MRACVLFITVAILTACLISAPTSAGNQQYYVDPVNGDDVQGNGSEAAPWKTTNGPNGALNRIIRLHPESQAGIVLNLRANALYPPLGLDRPLHGTPEQPFVIQPYDGDRVVFDGGEERFRQPSAWERVPDGVPDEWRTRDPFTTIPGHQVAWGQMMDNKLRLITYAHLEDLRAANESYRVVELSDPRPGLPVPGDETRKRLFAYIGPGVYYQFQNPERTIGHIHLRLSSTHINTAGIQDYEGGGDPNKMNLSIARTPSVAGSVFAQNVILKNLTFQNGGETTLQFGQAVRNVTFDHCQVYGARFGVRIPGNVSGLKFHHCTFDGGLAPWTTRSDVKDGVGNQTHNVLVIHGANQSEYVNCTFRRGHDGLQLTGNEVEVRDSLFEDLNDEVFPYNGTVTNVRIHGNVIRQALNINSFNANPTGGPIYFYRNVVDQRVPTRGERTLPPDAPTPWVWRYGSDFKNGPTPPFHVYQNTFISSHEIDKGSYVSQMFSLPDPTMARNYLNNLHLVLNLDLILSRVPSSSSPALSDGNVWYRFHVNPDPLFQQPMFEGPGGKKYFTFENLWTDFPNWERNSQHDDPRLTNFTDEYFEYESFYPNTDFRPTAGGPVGGRGITLPPNLPDDFPPGGGRPDVGARPVTAPVMAVGVDAATLLPAPGVPVAFAGSDQVIVDSEGDGFESVIVDGMQSTDPDGALTAYEWTEVGILRSTQASDTLYLPEGDHYLRLKVTDNDGKTDTDSVRINIRPLAPHGNNLLLCPGFEEECGWEIVRASRTSNAHTGRLALRMDALEEPRVHQRVAVSPGATYVVSAWIMREASPVDPAKIRVELVDANDGVLETADLDFGTTSSEYRYREGRVVSPPGAIAMNLHLGVLLLTGSVSFDDVRVLDGNLLVNGCFETRAPNGSEKEAPGWAFTKPGVIVSDPGDARSGRYAVALTPTGVPPDDFDLIEQKIVHVPGRSYRFSGWVKTTDVSQAPTYHVRFLGASGQGLGLQQIAAITSEGAYTYVSRDFLASDIPAATAILKVELRLNRRREDPPGTAFFDDILLELIP